MLRIFLFLCLLTLAACAKSPEQRLIEGQATIQQSLSIAEDTIIWSATASDPGLTIDTDVPLVLNFGGAFIQSSNFGESPNRYRGLAILLQRAPSVTIQSATFCGFQTGILAEAVQEIHLENCRFIDFSRKSQLPSVAIHVKQYSELNVENCHFQHLDRAFQMDTTTQLSVLRSNFLWLNRQVVASVSGSSGSFAENNFFYLGLPEAQTERTFTGGKYTFRQNNWAHVLRSGLPADLFTSQGNQAAYQAEPLPALWAGEQIDSLLRNFGVPAPGLRLQDEWGWYDFSYPRAWIREQRPEKDIFLLTAPNGNWRLIGGEGYTKVVPKTGNFPTTLQAFFEEQNKERFLSFEYLAKKFRKYSVHPAQDTPVSFQTDIAAE